MLIDNYDANLIMNLQWENVGELVNVEDTDAFIIKRGLFGKILVFPYLSFDKYSTVYKSILSHNSNLKEKYKAGRVLFVVMEDIVDDKILEHLEGVLTYDKGYINGGSFQVTFIDYNKKKGYFGGMREPGKTLLYRDT